MIRRREVVLLAMLAVTACANGERKLPVGTPGVVPGLVGQPLSRAVRLTEAAGLNPEVHVGGLAGPTIPLDTCSAARVTAQEPVSGSALMRGSVVTIGVDGCTSVTPSP